MIDLMLHLFPTGSVVRTEQSNTTDHLVLPLLWAEAVTVSSSLLSLHWSAGLWWGWEGLAQALGRDAELGADPGFWVDPDHILKIFPEHGLIRLHQLTVGHRSAGLCAPGHWVEDSFPPKKLEVSKLWSPILEDQNTEKAVKNIFSTHNRYTEVLHSALCANPVSFFSTIFIVSGLSTVAIYILLNFSFKMDIALKVTF